MPARKNRPVHVSTADFLVEIGTEELPPGTLLALADAFAAGIGRGLDEANLAHGAVERYATPRRLAVRVRRLATKQPDRSIERRGPPVTASFDTQGAPTQAALAFARSCGVEVASLARVETPKGMWLVHRGVEAAAAPPRSCRASSAPRWRRCRSPGACAGARATRSSFGPCTGW